MDQVLRRAVQAPRTAASEAMRRLTPDMQQLLLSFGAIPQWAAGAPASGAGTLRAAPGLGPPKPRMQRTRFLLPHPRRMQECLRHLRHLPTQARPVPVTDERICRSHQLTRARGICLRHVFLHAFDRPGPISRLQLRPLPQPGPPTRSWRTNSRPPGYCDIAGYEAFPRWNRPDAATAPEGVAVPIEDPSDQEMQEADAKNGPQSPGLGRMG